MKIEEKSTAMDVNYPGSVSRNLSVARKPPALLSTAADNNTQFCPGKKFPGRNANLAVLMLAIFAVAVCSSSAQGRPVKVWSHAELLHDADLVVIGVATLSHDEKEIDPKLPADAKIPVVTVFQVQSVLKGSVERKPGEPRLIRGIEIATVAVKHERYKDASAETAIIDGPGLVKFNSLLKNQYLMYLKKTAEPGVYEPVSGQFDPWTSFFLIEPYHTSHEQDRAGNADIQR